jgi:hypothetical protein
MTCLDVTAMPARDLLVHLLEYDSRDEIHAAITRWMKANPPPRTAAEITAWVDELLAPWYATYGDPRPRQARRADLMRFAESLIDPAHDFLSARLWLIDWLETPNPRIGGRCPDELLDSAEDHEKLKAILQADHEGTRNAPSSD